LLGLIIIFLPIYISHYKMFIKIKKFNDFLSVFVDFIFLNILLIIIDSYTFNHIGTTHWFLNIALPITSSVYLILNIFLAIRFLKINRLLKTSIILFLFNLITYIIFPFIKFKNPYIQNEVNDFNVFKSDLSNWQSEVLLERNINCIIFLTILGLAICFLISGLFVHFIRKKKTK
jgi:hypothetical protein